MSAHATTNAGTTTSAHTEEHLLHDHMHGGPKLYGAVLAVLLVLTAITVSASRIDVGSNLLNVVIAMLIASIKGSLVALFFMHLKWDRAINRVIFCTSLFFLALFLIACYTDVQARPPLEPTNLKAAPAAVGSGLQTAPGQLAPIPGHGPEGAASPSGGGPAIPGAAQQGSYGGAATGTHAPPVAPPSK